MQRSGRVERTLGLQDVGEATHPSQQLPVGHRQLIAGLVAFPGTATTSTQLQRQSFLPHPVLFNAAAHKLTAFKHSGQRLENSGLLLWLFLSAKMTPIH